MAHLKAPAFEWLDEAWRISEVFAGIANHPSNTNMLRVPRFEEITYPRLSEDATEAIELLQDAITARLVYRLQVTYKLQRHHPRGVRVINLDNRDPRVTLKSLKEIEACGVVLEHADRWAFDVHIKLGRILIDGFVSSEWKRQIPLAVVSIGGAFASRTASMSAKQPRQRGMNYLKSEKLRLQDQHPNYNCQQLLQNLRRIEVVIKGDATTPNIEWLDATGKEKTTKLKTFQNWKQG
jgi:hypothetical protein